jgi:hypothetical protein
MKSAKCKIIKQPAGPTRLIFQFSFLVFTFALALPAATMTNSPAATPVPAKSAPAAAVILPPPQSVFVVPKTPTEGKDPFFPSSSRVYTADNPVRQKDPVASVGDLALKGISGTAAEPLAIINSTTFTTGEESDVITAAGRMRVRCLEINMVKGTVLVQMGGERRELRLQPKK